jgi:hypothetical protein
LEIIMNSNKSTQNPEVARNRVYVAVATAVIVALFSGGAMAFVNGPLGNNNNNGITVPDPNKLGLLDQTASTQWPKITNPRQQTVIQQLGKAYFWDMQVAGDGVQSCASCHFHAGADHRKTNQMSPGLKAGDKVHGGLMPGPNGTLKIAHFGGDDGFGLPVSEVDLANALPDDLDGKSHLPILLDLDSDVNDVVSSQGIRLGKFISLNLINADPFSRPYGSVDNATLAEADDGLHGLKVINNVLTFDPDTDPTEGIGFNKPLGLLKPCAG